MALSTIKELCVVVLTLSWINAQEYIESLHDSKIGESHFKEIPRSFELQGFDANTQFQKYFDRIQSVALHENLDVIYKVKVEVLNINAKHLPKKHSLKKGKSKKYNIPLKKTSMKLSNFEVWLRKMAEQSGLSKKGHVQNSDNNVPVTTEPKGGKIITTTKQIQFKYKPIISRTKTNYTKYVMPVRSRVITLG